MRAVLQERFGPPDLLRLGEIDRPRPGPGEVLVRVHCAAVNPYDWHMMRGDPYAARLLGGMGLRRPKHRVAGIDAAGVVEAVGAGVDALRPAVPHTDDEGLLELGPLVRLGELDPLLSADHPEGFTHGFLFLPFHGRQPLSRTAARACFPSAGRV